MKLVAAILLLCGLLSAQTQGLLPTVIDSINSGADNTSCGFGCQIMPDGANTGDLIVVAAVQPDTSVGTPCGNPNPPWTVTDSLGNTYTAETSGVTPTVGGSTNDYIQFFHTVSGSTGANDIFINWTVDCSGQIFVARGTNISGTTDGLNTATAGPSATPVIVSTSNTPTVNGDLFFSFGAVNSGPQGLINMAPPLQYLGTKGTTLPEVNAAFGFANGGLSAVSQGLSMSRYAGNTAGAVVMQTLAFKPAAIAIVDTTLPRGALFNTYSATIHGVGGAGAYACSITVGSLQTGLSLGGTGNCTISGTPTAATTNSITFQITDTGSVHTTTKVLSLEVDATTGTPFLANYATGTFDNGGGTASITVNCGDVIVMQLAPAADTHGSTGWLQAQNGSSNFYSDSMNLPFTRVPGIGSILSGGLVTYLIGPAVQGGIDVITGHNAQGNSAALEFQITAVRGVQAIADYGSFNNFITPSSSTTTLTTTYVAPVANEFIESNTLDENGGSSISLGAPFSSLNSGSSGFNFYNFGIATGQTGTVSHAASITSGSFHTQSTQLIGLRPAALPATCPVISTIGEKIRRQVF